MKATKLDEFDSRLAVKAVRQISKALLSGSAPNPRLYRDPNMPYFKAIENVVVDVVYEWFAVKKAPIFRDTLITLVRNRIMGRRARGLWRDADGVEMPIPAYDTIRRRVNCTAEPQYYGGTAPCLMISDELLGREATFYLPNPGYLTEDKRGEVEEVLKRWSKR